MPLSETAIRALKPADKARRVADERGLYIEVSPAGGKLWRLKYRFGGREKRLALGVYPEVSLRLARERREEARTALARGVDPSVTRRAEKAVKAVESRDTFEAIAREFHLKQTQVWSGSHSDRWLGRMVMDLFPVLGREPVASITAPDLLKVLRTVEDRTLETAHRLLRQSGQVFRYAIATGRATRDLSADLKGALRAYRPGHFAAPTEPEDFKSVLKRMYAYQGGVQVTCALRLAPLIFLRPGELRQMLKANLNLEDSTYRFISSKTKMPMIVPLCTQAVDLLQWALPYSGDSIYVLPGARSKKRPMSDNAVLAALRSMEIGKEEATGHGFRATARTILDEVLGFRPDIIEHQLAHEVRDANGRAYNRTTFLSERRAMMQKWADYCDELRTGVVTMAKRPA